MSCLRRTSANQPGSSLKAEVRHNQSASLQRPSIEERIADASRGDIPADKDAPGQRNQESKAKHNQSAGLQRPSIEEPRIADASRGDIYQLTRRTRATQPGRQKSNQRASLQRPSIEHPKQQVAKGHPTRSRGLPIASRGDRPADKDAPGQPTQQARI